MKKVYSIIEVIRDESAQGNKDWQIVTGQEQFRHDDYFQHEETGAEYSWLSGALAWPVMAEGKEGCAVVVGCSRDDKPKFSVVDAGFNMTPKGLILECVRLRDKWCGGGSALFSSFVGPDESLQMRAEINNELANGYPKQDRIIIRTPPDFDEHEADRLYLNTVQELSEDSRLRSDIVPVRDALTRMTVQDADKKLSDSPTVAAVAYVLHEMMTIKPWLADGAGPILLV